MARFIIDIGNIEDFNMAEVCKDISNALIEYSSYYEINTVNCIDNTNNNQFYTEFDNGETNELSEEQINNFKKVCNV